MLLELKTSSTIPLEAFPGHALFAARTEINFYLQARGGRAIKKQTEGNADRICIRNVWKRHCKVSKIGQRGKFCS